MNRRQLPHNMLLLTISVSLTCMWFMVNQVRLDIGQILTRRVEDAEVELIAFEESNDVIY